MAADRVSLSRVLEIHLPLTWQDAIAIVETVALAQAERRLLSRPPARLDESCLYLTAAGRIEFTEDAATPTADAELQLLRSLLAGRSVPPELETLAFGPPPTSLLDALSMFSRPDRQAPIAAVARRTLEAERELPASTADRAQAPSPAAPVTPPVDPLPPSPAVDTPEHELTRLRARTHIPRRVEGLEAGRAAAPPRRRFPVVATSAAVIVIAAIAVGVRLLPRAAVPSATNAVAPPVAATPQPVREPDAPPAPPLLTRAAEFVRGALGLAPNREGRTTDIALASARPAARPGGRATPPPAADTAAASTGPPASTPELAAPPDDALAAVPPAPASDEPVHSWRTSTATPPVMTYPRMPRAAFPERAVPVDGQYLEVLVDTQGSVERVWVRGEAATREGAFRTSMMMSAAKAWQFVPAHVEGRPVPYVVRIVLSP